MTQTKRKKESQPISYKAEITYHQTDCSKMFLVKIGGWYWFACAIWRSRIAFRRYNQFKGEEVVPFRAGIHYINGVVTLSRRFVEGLKQPIADSLGDFADPFVKPEVIVKFKAKKRV